MIIKIPAAEGPAFSLMEVVSVAFGKVNGVAYADVAKADGTKERVTIATRAYVLNAGGDTIDCFPGR